MPQSLVQNYLHIVFSTKYREPLIDESVEQELHNYLGGLCNQFDSPVIRVGGYWDHVHILCRLSKNLAIAKLMELVKANSSKWIKGKGEKYQNFYWQRGYGAFSVNPLGLNNVIRYIENQHQHHRHQDFKSEMRSFYKTYDIDYDERYVWD